MMSRTLALALAGAVCISACSNAEPIPIEGNGISLRNLAETDTADTARREPTVQGRLVPTPSDTRTRHFLLRERRAIGSTVIAIFRQEQGGRVAYSRSEVDCAKRLFHVVGVGRNRALVETNIAHDGPLRPITGLPLREELARFVCDASGTPLAPLSAPVSAKA